MAYTPSATSPVPTSQDLRTRQNSNVSESEAALSTRRVRFTTKWELINAASNEKAQVVEVTIANLLPTFSLSRSTSINSIHTISIKSSGVKTLRAGTFSRLVPGDQARVDVLISGAEKVKMGEKAVVEVRDAKGELVGSSGGWDVAPLVEKWTTDRDVLARHEAPTWVRSTTKLLRLLVD